MAAHQPHLERDSRFFRITERRGRARIRHRHDDIRDCRRFARERPPMLLADLIHVAAVNLAVGPREIHVLEDASLGRRVRERTHRSQPALVDDDHLARIDFSNIFGAHQVQRAGLRRHDRRAVQIAEYQRTEALRVAHRDHRIFRQHHQRVRAAHLRQCLRHPLRQGRLVRRRDQMNHHLAVRRRLENRARRLQPFAQLLEIYNVAVVRERQPAARILDNQRLAVADSRRASRRVAVMPNRAGAFELLDDRAVEDVGDQTHPAMRDQRLAVRRHDSRRLLPAMLLRVEPEVREVGRLRVSIARRTRRIPRGRRRGSILRLLRQQGPSLLQSPPLSLLGIASS